MTLPAGSLYWHALRTAQANESAREATQAARDALREQAAVAFDAAAKRRRLEPETAAILAASGDALMAAADAVERIAEAQCMTTGLLVMLGAREG